MDVAFYTTGAVALVSAVMVITRASAVHALLYLVVSLLAVAVVFALLGAPFAAALEVIVYAGAIVVLLVFAAMMLDLGREGIERERRWLAPRAFAGPALLALVVMVELAYVLVVARSGDAGAAGAGSAATGTAAVAAGSAAVVVDPTVVPHRTVPPAEVGAILLGPYVIGVEIASMLLLAGLVGALHVGRRQAVAAREGGGAP
ncbi:MAG: NADH-quinone oxidoreductase subunit J [Candidatus Eiseniibacteriota bacterium]|jgi:NADH-quinone oxidoreductase subunit J